MMGLDLTILSHPVVLERQSSPRNEPADTTRSLGRIPRWSSCRSAAHACRHFHHAITRMKGGREVSEIAFSRAHNNVINGLGAGPGAAPGEAEASTSAYNDWKITDLVTRPRSSIPATYSPKEAADFTALIYPLDLPCSTIASSRREGRA